MSLNLLRWPLIALTFCLSGCDSGVTNSSNGSGASAGEVRKETETTLAQKAGAPLFDGMGSFSMPITTANPDAQRYFDQGMVLAFAFNHAESIRSFRAAQTLDPSCAMCFWGEALATGPNINVTSKGKVIMSPSERVAAFAALQSALALKDGASEHEAAYIFSTTGCVKCRHPGYNIFALMNRIHVGAWFWTVFDVFVFLFRPRQKIEK